VKVDDTIEYLRFNPYLFVETPNFQPPPNLRPILAFIRTQHEHGRPVLAHCFAGIGRAGTVLAAWLLQQDRSSRMSSRYGLILDACFQSPSPSFMSTVSSVNRMVGETGSPAGVCDTIASR